MSPNGRRAWREWVRRQDLRRKHKQPKGSVCRMARQARRHIPLVPGVVLPKPLTASSLVGMTMGARKKAWLSNALYPVVFPSGIITDETDMQAGYSWPEIRYDWPLLGERLRPCEGCEECRGYDDGIGVIHCDGSGVLPARRS